MYFPISVAAILRLFVIRLRLYRLMERDSEFVYQKEGKKQKQKKHRFWCEISNIPSMYVVIAW